MRINRRNDPTAPQVDNLAQIRRGDVYFPWLHRAAAVLSSLSSTWNVGTMAIATIAAHWAGVSEGWPMYTVYALAFVFCLATDLVGVAWAGLTALVEIVAYSYKCFYVPMGRRIFGLGVCTIFVSCFWWSYKTSKDGMASFGVSDRIAKFESFSQVSDRVRIKHTESLGNLNAEIERIERECDEAINRALTNGLKRDAQKGSAHAAREIANIQATVRKPFDKRISELRKANEAKLAKAQSAIDEEIKKEWARVEKLQAAQDQEVSAISAMLVGLGAWPSIIQVVLLLIEAIVIVNRCAPRLTAEEIEEAKRQAEEDKKRRAEAAAAKAAQKQSTNTARDYSNSLWGNGWGN